MTRNFLLVIGALTSLAACSDPDPAAGAERELAMIEKAHGSADEICAAKRKVADAYLKAHDEHKYSLARASAGLACNAALLDRLD